MAYLKLFSLMALTIIQSIALSTPIQPSLNTTAVVPITPPHLPPNTSLNTDLLENLTAHGRPVCTGDPQWQMPGDAGAGIYTSACFLALREMGIQEYIISTPSRFLSATSTGSYEEVTVLTPKRYVYNLEEISCTVVVAMLCDFRPSTEVLPRAPRGPFQRTVSSDWLSVYQAAHAMLIRCLAGAPQFGYVTLRRQNLGVFFWATRSAMNGYLPPYVGLEANLSIVETE